jgi:hypothetical protein
MKIGIVLLLLVFGQFAYADDRLCEVDSYGSGFRKDRNEINDYVLEQCQDGDILYISNAWSIDFLGKHCKAGTIYTVELGAIFCEYRKEAREVIRPSEKEWKQMKKNLKK